MTDAELTKKMTYQFEKLNYHFQRLESMGLTSNQIIVYLLQEEGLASNESNSLAQLKIKSLEDQIKLLEAGVKV